MVAAKCQLAIWGAITDSLQTDPFCGDCGKYHVEISNFCRVMAFHLWWHGGCDDVNWGGDAVDGIRIVHGGVAAASTFIGGGMGKGI